MQYRDRKLKINISVSKRFRKKNEHYEVIKEAGEPWITSSSADYIKPHIYMHITLQRPKNSGRNGGYSLVYS